VESSRNSTQTRGFVPDPTGHAGALRRCSEPERPPIRMLLTRPLRPARMSRRRAAASTTAAVTAAIGVIALTGIASSSAFADVGETGAIPAAMASSGMPAFGLPVQAEVLSDVRADAEATLELARAARADASVVAVQVAASGLDVGPKTSVDTTELTGQIDRLAGLDILPLMLLPGVAKATTAETKDVEAETATLRGHLNGAISKQAAAEAAAEAQRKAEAAAAAAAQAEAAAAAAAAANTPDGAKATARQLLGEFGWGGDQFSCLESLWTKESGWNYQAYNPSGATGIPQSLPGSKMASAGADWQSNATTQIRWGLGYIKSVYGTPCSAWGHSQSTNWY